MFAQDAKQHPLHIRSSLGHLAQGNVELFRLRTNLKLSYPCDDGSAVETTQNVPKRNFQNPHRHLCELLHSDIFEMAVCSYNGFKYFALLVYDNLGYSHLVLLHKQPDIYRGFSAGIDEGSIAISAIQTNQG